MRGGRSLSLLLLLVALSVQESTEKAQHQITFYDEETFDKVKKIDDVKASFFLSRFALAEHETKCQGNDKEIIVPIYFHSGGTVELPCKMCEWAFVTNGLPKSWKHIPLHHATKFLEKPETFLREHAEDENYVQSLARSLTPAGGGFHRRARLLRRMYDKTASKDGSAVPPPQKIASIHNFVQSDGKLYIHGTILESSGIYFCHDEKSLNAHTRVFFLLMAMAPLVHHSKATGDPNIASIWNVDAWLSSGQKEYEPKCAVAGKDPMPDEYAHMRYTPAEYGSPNARFETLPIDVTYAAGTSGGRTQLTNLQIAHEEGEWTPCREKIRYREMHCVLKRINGMKIPVGDLQPYEFVRWASSLNAYFDLFPTLRLHSYFLTSLIYKGDTYGADKNKETPVECDERARKIWEYYKQTFLSTLYSKGSTTYTSKTFEEQLVALETEDNPAEAIMAFQTNNNACFELAANMEEKWWSIRGISFIQNQTCT